ncbi:MAG: DUF1837 domain-containing protein [Ruminococcus sp.]|nr:DUF1837 domain-containing protein [Ruminococcus sp.]
MILCFASLGKILFLCRKPKVPQKVLCGKLLSSINWEYGYELESNDTVASRLLGCITGLSDAITQEIPNIDIEDIKTYLAAEVIPLLDDNKHAVILGALKAIVKDDGKLYSDTLIGSRMKSDIISKTNNDLAGTISDILYYTAAYVDNRTGKPFIGQINEEYIARIEKQSQRPNVKIVENTELQKTITDSCFDEVFSHIEGEAALKLSNQCGIDMYYLDMTDSAFDYFQLGEYLLDCVGMYVYSRSQIKEFEDAKKIRNLGLKAVRAMNENGPPDEKGTGNELGEMLIYTLIEEVLDAPKLLSKVEISGTKSKSDGIHLLKRNENGRTKYQLIFGTSSIHNDIFEAVDEAFEIVSEIKAGQINERKTAQNTLYNNTYDTETTEVLKSILIPSKDKSRLPDMAFGVFIGYSLNICNDNNDDFIEEAISKMKKDIETVIPYIADKAANMKLGMHSYYFYFLPMNHAEEDKKEIMYNLLGGV